MRPVLKWAAIGCGCLSTGIVLLFGILVALELNGTGLSRLSATPASAAVAKPTSTAVRAAAVAPAPTVAPKPAATATAVPAPTTVPKVGTSTTLSAPSGLRISVTANAVNDPSPSSNQYNQPDGRWVVVDWTVKNEGETDQQVNASWLKVMTVGDFVVTSGNHAGHPTPDFESGVLGPGQSRRGFSAYDIPDGQKLKAAIFQAPGSRQFVIAAVSD